MTAYEKLKQYEQQYHELNEESIELRNKMFKTEQDTNTLIQLRYASLVGKAFKGRDYMTNGDLIISPPAPFFVYSLPPISWNRDGMSFNPYQLPILRMGIDNECGGEDCPVLMIDTLHTDVFKAEDVYKEFIEPYEEISRSEFQEYVNNEIGKYISEVNQDFTQWRNEYEGEF